MVINIPNLLRWAANIKGVISGVKSTLSWTPWNSSLLSLFLFSIVRHTVLHETLVTASGVFPAVANLIILLDYFNSPYLNPSRRRVTTSVLPSSTACSIVSPAYTFGRLIKNPIISKSSLRTARCKALIPWISRQLTLTYGCSYNFSEFIEKLNFSVGTILAVARYD